MKQIPLNSEERRELGRAYVQQIEEIRSERVPLQETWRQAQEDYEGKAPQLDFPWPDNVSSNAVIPIIPTHCNAIRARLYNTATGQDPIFFPQLTGWGDIGGGQLDRDAFGRTWALLSEWVEQKDVPIRHILNQAINIQVKYGDVIIYCPWVSRKRYDYRYDEASDEWIKGEEMVETVGKPKLMSIHPENFYIPTHETDIDAIQTAKFVAYDFSLCYDEIKHFITDETFTAAEGEELLKLLRPEDTDQKYFNDQGDSLIVGREADYPRMRQERLDTGLDDEVETGKLHFYHVWASEDMDGDGYEEEIQFFVHATTGIVPHITWNFYEHKKRPFVRLSYEERDGVFYSIGIPEMLANIQKIMNEIMRDVLNNNKVQNTKIFLVRKGAGIEPKTRLWPGRMLFLDNPAGDFIPQDMGSGRQVTSISDMFTLQQWAERRDSIIDFNLGQERTSRTPATTTLALLEEANKTLDMVIRRMRMALEDLWDMVLSLYVQYGFPDRALEVLIGEDADLVMAAIDDMNVDDMRRALRFYARVNTQNLNRSVRRQEALTEFGTIREMHGASLGIIQAIKQNPDDPALQEVLRGQYRGLHRIIGRFLDTFDEYQQDVVNPDYLELLEEVTPGIAPTVPALDQQPTAGPGGPVENALGASSNVGKPTGPSAPPGRPIEGQERVPQGAPEERNLI